MKKKVLAVITAVVLSFTLMGSAFAAGSPTNITKELSDGILADTSGLNDNLGKLTLVGNAEDPADIEYYLPDLFELSGANALYFSVYLLDETTWDTVNSGFGKLTISLPITDEGVYRVYQYCNDPSHDIHVYNVTSSGGFVTFTVDHLSVFALVYLGKASAGSNLVSPYTGV